MCNLNCQSRRNTGWLGMKRSFNHFVVFLVTQSDFECQQKKLDETEKNFRDAQEKIRAAHYSIREREYVINKLQESGVYDIHMYLSLYYREDSLLLIHALKCTQRTT